MDHKIPGIDIPGLNIEAFLKTVQSPYDTQAVFDKIRTLATSSALPYLSTSMREQFDKDEGLHALYVERYAPRYLTNDELMECPANSLGRSLGEHLIRNNITLEFQGIDMSQIYDKQQDIYDYGRLRALRVHDILHVLLGADTSPIGEGVVSAFLAAQYTATFHSMSIATMSLHVAFFDNAKLPVWIKGLSDALQAGARATPVFGVAWESLLNEDLEMLRERFKITPVRTNG